MVVVVVVVVVVVDGCWAVGGGWLGGRRWAMGGGDQRTIAEIVKWRRTIVVAMVVGAPAQRLGYLHVGGTVAVAVHVHVRSSQTDAYPTTSLKVRAESHDPQVSSSQPF